MTRHLVCRSEDIPPGTRKVVTVAGRAILVVNCDAGYFAVRDSCPHQGAPLSRGSIGGTMLPSRPHEYVYGLEGRILRCPWHGLEFDLATGCSLTDPERFRVKAYPVLEERGDVVLDA